MVDANLVALVESDLKREGVHRHRIGKHLAAEIVTELQAREIDAVFIHEFGDHRVGQIYLDGPGWEQDRFDIVNDR